MTESVAWLPGFLTERTIVPAAVLHERLFAGASAVEAGGGWSWGGGLPCLFKLLTGLDCPGCGGTRAALALLHGKPLLSFFYHPLPVYCAGVALWLAGHELLYRATGKQEYRRYLDDGYLYAGLALTAVNFIAKNSVIVALGLDILEALPGI